MIYEAREDQKLLNIISEAAKLRTPDNVPPVTVMMPWLMVDGHKQCIDLDRLQRLYEDYMTPITAEEAALVRRVLATTGRTAPMHERHEARRIVDRFLPPMPSSGYAGFKDWPDA